MYSIEKRRESVAFLIGEAALLPRKSIAERGELLAVAILTIPTTNSRSFAASVGVQDI
ncbi:MAG: hypothetical protein ACI9HK_001414 [Pirellulaceae bacterium]|jgi:hypothetical protein